MFVENKATEFKRKYVEDIKNTIVAVANCDGGTLYIGVNDDGTACGVDNVDDTTLRVTNAVRDVVRQDRIICKEKEFARRAFMLPRSINSSGNRCRHPEYDQGDQWRQLRDSSFS